MGESMFITIDDLRIPVHSMNTLIIGSGAAGLNAAVQLVRRGQRDVAIVTERWGAGASSEAGSDKQTYYKLAMAHGGDDSPRRMAEDLLRGGCMHGDIALCEAQHSAEAFHNLVALGVPFPHDAYGAFVGYRTDHDPAGRGTSAGPLTSRSMFECLGRKVSEEGVAVFDEHSVVALLTRQSPDGPAVCGALAIDRNRIDEEAFGLVAFNAVNVILATGGPGGMYESSVYPESQVGSTGLALAIGAAAQNLTESQFGIASIAFRWNLSGSYQQVIPRYLSTDRDGGDEREFLNSLFPDMKSLAGAIFRKGYEWPFDSRKVRGGGSSLIDVLVHRETVELGRRVFLDYTRNPEEDERLDSDALDAEAREYLATCDALRATPIARLRAMNEPAYQLYLDHGIDLAREKLEIAVCAQHCNGGLAADMWWQSNVPHLFPIGEVNGSHGVYRPGGAALNAGQVGGIRAAMYIEKRGRRTPPIVGEFADLAGGQLRGVIAQADRMLSAEDGRGIAPAEVITDLRRRMSLVGANVRDAERVKDAIGDAWRLHARAQSDLAAPSRSSLAEAFQALDLALTHAVYLEALGEYLSRGGGSRGSYLVIDRKGVAAHEELGDAWRFAVADDASPASRRILEVRLDGSGDVQKEWVDPRPIPEPSPWFEMTWADFIADRVIGSKP